MAERKDNFQARDIYLVDIEIIRALNLAKADTFGLSDGFVKVECLNRKFRTVTIKNNLDPKWNARTQFQFFRKPKQVKFRVLDWNSPPQKDKPIGHYTVNLKDSYFVKGNEGFKKQIVDLINVKRGQIEISLCCSKLEPLDYLDRMRECAGQKQQYITELETCETDIKNCESQYDKIQQACVAYEQKINQIDEECKTKEAEKNTCEEQVRKCDTEIKTVQDECNILEGQYNKLVKEYKDKDYDCDQVITVYNTTQQQYESYQQKAAQDIQSYEEEIQRRQEQAYEQEDNTYESKQQDITYGTQAQQQDNIIEYESQQQQGYDTKEPSDEVIPASGEYLEAIKEYEENIGKNDDEYDPYDDQLFTDILNKFKELTDIYSSGLVEDDEQNEEYTNAKEEANTILLAINRFTQRCTELIYEKAEKTLDEYDYTDGEEKNFFINCYVQLNKFFFCLLWVDAALQCFEHHIKNHLHKKKKISAVTFYDLAGSPGGKSEEKGDSYDAQDLVTVWGEVFEKKLDFVMEGLGNIFSDQMKDKPLQNMCRLVNDFIGSAYNGNYTQFSKLISHYIWQMKVEEEIEANTASLVDDSVSGTILILGDRKSFFYKLFHSIKDNAPKPKEKEDNTYENADAEVNAGYGDEEQDDGYDDMDDTTEVEDKFEQIAALIIISVCQLEWLPSVMDGSTKLDKKDKKLIDEKLDLVLAKCAEYDIDRKSQRLIKQFFGYFFVPEKGGGCCDCSGGDDAGFFGKLFGSICK